MFKLCMVLILSSLMVDGMAQNRDSREALLIIDIQDFYFPGGDVPLENPEEAAANAALLLNYFRENNMPVVFIRHNSKSGGSIHQSVKPLEGEKVISKDYVNAFIGTGLNEYLYSLDVNSLVICGMQTHMCVEAAIRAGADYGKSCILIHDACATRDLKFGEKTVSAEDVHFSTLSTLGSYAKVISTREYLAK